MIKTFDQSGITLDTDAEEPNIPTKKGAKGSSIDTSKNNLIEAIEEALDADRTRGGNALNTETILIESDEGVLFPVGAVRITVQVTYDFTQGAT